MSIRLPTFNLLIDPLINCLLSPCTWLIKINKCRFQQDRQIRAHDRNFCQKFCLWDYTPCQRRERSYHRVADKLSDEMEIVSLLKKIREMHGMLKYSGKS